MHLIDSAGNVGNDFQDGDPGVPTPGTVVDQDWLNMVQREMYNILVAAGVTPVKGTNNQLAAAIVLIDGDQTVGGRKSFTDAASAELMNVTNTGSGSALKAANSGTTPTIEAANNSTGAGLKATSGGHTAATGEPIADTTADAAFEAVKGGIRFLGANPSDSAGHLNFLSVLGLIKGWAYFQWSNGAPTLTAGMNMAAPGNTGGTSSGQIQVNLTTAIGTGAMVVIGNAGAANYIVAPQNSTGLIKISTDAGVAVNFGSTTGFAFVLVLGRQVNGG